MDSHAVRAESRQMTRRPSARANGICRSANALASATVRRVRPAKVRQCVSSQRRSLPRTSVLARTAWSRFAWRSGRRRASRRKSRSNSTKSGREVPARQIQDELLPHMANPYGDPNIVLHYFSDVPPTHKYYRAIQYLASRGFLPPESGDKFLSPISPYDAVLNWQGWLNLLANAGLIPAHGFADASEHSLSCLSAVFACTYMGSYQGALGLQQRALQS